MTKTNKLSHSQVNKYSECGLRYYYHYVKRFRSSTSTGSLLFGAAIDQALNTLLKTRNYEEAVEIFKKCISFTTINNKTISACKSDLIIYAEKDYDKDLILPEDLQKWTALQYSYNYEIGQSMPQVVNSIRIKRSQVTFHGLSEQEKILFGYASWLSLYRKGLYLIKDYNLDIMPKIKNVLAVQHAVDATNEEGDSVIGFVDCIVEMEDGKRYLVDNKTSAIDYEADSAETSQQLIWYYHLTKEEFKLDGVAYIVLNKNLNKNRVKICSKCSYDGTGGRHKTCDNLINNERCNGEWTETVAPKTKITVIPGTISPIAEGIVLQTFDEANNGIVREVFNPNLSACNNGKFKCTYFDYCWKGKSDGLVQLD